MIEAESKFGARREITPSRRAGLLFRPADHPFLNSLETELGAILHEGPGATKTAYRLEEDEHDTRWVVLEDGHFPDLVSSAYTVGNAMARNGAASNRIALVFEFYRATVVGDDGGWSSGSNGYWIYRYDRQRFYPFVPQDGNERDRPAEMQISNMMRQAGVKVDKALEEWRPVWGIPF